MDTRTGIKLGKAFLLRFHRRVIWFSFQALVNVGAAAGMLPTKGLTLPLISYGGSSLLIMSTAIMMLLRIDYETRLEKAQAFVRGSR